MSSGDEQKPNIYDISRVLTEHAIRNPGNEDLFGKLGAAAHLGNNAREGFMEKSHFNTIKTRYLKNIDTMDINELRELCDKLYLKLNKEERETKYELLKRVSSPELNPNCSLFPFDLSRSTRLGAENVPEFYRGWWNNGGETSTPSYLYDVLKSHRLFNTDEANERKYYVTIYKVLIAPSDAVSIGGKRRRNQKTKRRKGKTKKTKRSRRRSAKRV